MDANCLHDFIAPEQKPEHAICATCGSEPKYADYGDGTMVIRYLPVKEWVDLALACLTPKQ
jgi:hypothetical protein